MNRCCLRAFATQGVVENFRIAKDGERFRCPSCGTKFIKALGKWCPELDITVHVLLAGLPLCGFSDALPRDWPGGHAWVHGGEDEIEMVTCALCRRLAEQRLRQRGGRTREV